MKFLFSLVFSFVFTGFVWAVPAPQPLLVKTVTEALSQWGGVVYRCEIWPERNVIVVTKSIGALETVETKQVEIKGDLISLVQEAQNGPITSPRVPTYPIEQEIVLEAHLFVPPEEDVEGGHYKKVLLMRGGTVNQSSGSQLLIKFLARNCPAF